MKDPTEELTGILSSLWWWDISLALNMTYFFILRHSERSEESHRRTDRHILLTLVVGYFACAQYDVRVRGGELYYCFYYIVPYFAEKINKYLVKFDKIFIFVFTFLSKCVKIYKNTT